MSSCAGSGFTPAVCRKFARFSPNVADDGPARFGGFVGLLLRGGAGDGRVPKPPRPSLRDDCVVFRQGEAEFTGARECAEG